MSKSSAAANRSRLQPQRVEVPAPPANRSAGQPSKKKQKTKSATTSRTKMAKQRADKPAGSLVTDIADDSVFLTPRVIDARSYEEMSSNLRSLVEHATAATSELGEIVSKADALNSRLTSTTRRFEERLNLGARLFESVDKRANEVVEIAATISDEVDYLESLRADAGAIINQERTRLTAEAKQTIDNLRASRVVIEEELDSEFDGIQQQIRQWHCVEENMNARLDSLEDEIQVAAKPSFDRLQNLIECAQNQLQGDKYSKTLAGAMERIGESRLEAETAIVNLHEVETQCNQLRSTLGDELLTAAGVLDGLADENESIQTALDAAATVSIAINEQADRVSNRVSSHINAKVASMDIRVQQQSDKLDTLSESTESATQSINERSLHLVKHLNDKLQEAEQVLDEQVQDRVSALNKQITVHTETVEKLHETSDRTQQEIIKNCIRIRTDLNTQFETARSDLQDIRKTSCETINAATEKRLGEMQSHLNEQAKHAAALEAQLATLNEATETRAKDLQQQAAAQLAEAHTDMQSLLTTSLSQMETQCDSQRASCDAIDSRIQESKEAIEASAENALEAWEICQMEAEHKVAGFMDQRTRTIDRQLQEQTDRLGSMKSEIVGTMSDLDQKHEAVATLTTTHQSLVTEAEKTITFLRSWDRYFIREVDGEVIVPEDLKQTLTRLRRTVDDEVTRICSRFSNMASSMHKPNLSTDNAEPSAEITTRPVASADSKSG